MFELYLRTYQFYVHKHILNLTKPQFLNKITQRCYILCCIIADIENTFN